MRREAINSFETKAPEGYKLDETPIEFTIEKGQPKAVELVVSNQKVKTPTPDNRINLHRMEM
ncbi:SpaA isopeptide-forming pilin-related protein [Bacillus spizizenii]